MSRCAETSILFRNRQENFGLGFKILEIENKCFQIVKWHILKYSLDGIMRSLYEHKLNQEKEGNLEKAEKQTEHHAWLWSDSKLLLSLMNALDKTKPQSKELGGSRTNQSHSPKCQTNNNVAN